MKKHILIATTALIAVACGTTKKTTTPEAVVEETKVAAPVAVQVEQGETVTISPTSNSQSGPVKPVYKTMLLGKEKRASLEKLPFDAWFSSNYKKYNVDESLIPEIKNGLKDVSLTIFMGTWCGDSKRETPRMYKILDATGFEEENTTLITVDRSKKNPTEFTDGRNIIRVPTFIFMKDGKELGRIVERPVVSLEADMLKILNGETYKHAYEK